MNEKAPRPYRVAVNGLPHFCKKLTELVNGDGWEVPYRSPFHPVGLAARFSDLARCDLAYSWMGRISMGKFLRAAKSLGKTKIIMLWCGSDALFAKDELAQGKLDSWVANRVHWAVSPWLAQEVRELGIACEYVQVSFVESISPMPLPKKFSVLTYVSSIKKAHLYGLDLILQVARKLPSMKFTLVGLEEGKIPEAPPNLEVFRRLDLASFYEQATVLWRPVRHDGLSFMVLEALARGRHVLYSYPLRGCIQVAGAEMACEQLERLRELDESGRLEPNEIGRQYVASEYDPQKVRTEILNRWKDLILSPESEFRKSGVLETP
jgi:hypothetical protein